MSQPKAQYRLLVFGRPLTRWWKSREDIENYAIKEDLASRDEHSGKVFLDAVATIQIKDGA